MELDRASIVQMNRQGKVPNLCGNTEREKKLGPEATKEWGRTGSIVYKPQRGADTKSI